MQKGFAHLLLIAIILIVSLSAIGVYFFIFKNQSPVISEQMVAPEVISQQPTQNQVYKNQNLGFEFVLPEGSTVKDETEEEFHKRSNGQMRKNFTYYVQYAPAEFVSSLYVLGKDNDYENAALSLWVFENPKDLDASAFYEKYWYYPFIWGDFSSGKERIAPTIDFNIADSTASGAVAAFKPNSPKFMYLPREGKMYLFKVVGDSKIIDSFKFSK